MFMRALAALLASALLSGCAATGGVSKVVVERTGCARGSCPAYTVSVESGGSVRYEGTSSVKVIGVRAGTVTAADWTLLEKALEGADFFALSEHYGSNSGGCTSTWNHHPTINITVTRNDVSKRVSYYTGCWGLREGKVISWLATTADMVTDSARWVHESLEDDL